jgi:WD40 repeat protein
MTRILAVAFLALGLYSAFAQTGPTLQPQSGHTDMVKVAAISGDGRLLISGSDDKTAILWDPASGKQLRVLQGGYGSLTSVALSADGSKAYVGYFDYKVRIWDTASGEVIQVLEGFGKPINYLALAPKEDLLLAATSLDKSAALWELPSGRRIWSASYDQKISKLAFIPGRREAALRLGGETWRIDLGTGAKLSPLPGATQFAISADGRYLYSTGPSAIKKESLGMSLRQFDLASGKELRSFTGHRREINALAVSPDGKLLLSGSGDCTLKLWSTASGKELRTLTGHDAAITSAFFSPDGHFAFSSSGDYGSTDYSIRMWELETGNQLRAMEGKVDLAIQVAFSPDGTRLLAGYGHSGLRLWENESGKLVSTMRQARAYKNYMTAAAISPDGKTALAANSDRLELWDLETGAWIRTVGEEGDTIQSVAYSPDGRTALTAGRDLVVLWDIAGKMPRRNLHLEKVKAAAFSPDGRLVVGGSTEGKLQVWEAASGKILTIATLPVPASADKKGRKGNEVRGMAISPDGAHLVLSAGDSSIQIWSLPECRLLRVLPAERGFFQPIVFSPDGRLVLTAAVNRGLSLWEFESGRELRAFSAHTNYIRAAAFSPDGRYMASCADDATLRLWDVGSGECLYSTMADISGSRWLVVSPDGYWDGSPDAGELVAMVRGREVWDIDQFAIRNNRPDLIARRTGASPRLVEHLEAQYRKRLRRLGLSEESLTADYRAPTAKILAVSRNGKLLDLRLEFSAAQRPLTRYNVYVNGVPLFGALGKSLSGARGEASERIELVEGENQVEVSCMDEGGAESYRAQVAESYSGKEKPDLYYLGFGVSNYKDPQINDLLFAAKDALDLEQAFKRMAGRGFGRVFTRVYTDEKVTRGSIAEAKLFVAKARPDDVFVLFIAGHGIQIVDAADESGLQAALATFYYVTSDSLLEDIPSTSAPFELVEDLLQGVAPRRKLFLMDTCQSGEIEEGMGGPGPDAAGGRGFKARAIAPEGGRGLAVQQADSELGSFLRARDRYIYNDLFRRSGAIVFSSSRGNEFSLEDGEWRQGAFTYKILEAFASAAADADKDGSLGTDELRAFVSEEVPRLTEGLQHPTVDRDNIRARFGFPAGGAK